MGVHPANALETGSSTSLQRTLRSASQLHQHLQKRPITILTSSARALDLTVPPVAKAIDRLSGLGIMAEITGRRRDRVYIYRRYLDLLAEGTEPLPMHQARG